jgi:UDP-N-acetylglucosamine--N-acetylmuramyl-(pentapeptide) pyrophosphoryl-undecaprenol N-acetylglucosamine transferase
MEGAFERKVAQGWVNRIPRPRKVDWLGTPVRAEIARIAPPGERLAARTGPLRLLVVGGSLGAQTLNDLVLAALVSMPPESRPEVVHQSGEKLYERLHAAYRAAGMQGEVVSFIDDMARRYAWCDLLVCRSGAITVAEITAAGIAAILFPLPWFVVDEQTANAPPPTPIAAFDRSDVSPRGARGAAGPRARAPGRMARRRASLSHPDATARADAYQELARAA